MAGKVVEMDMQKRSTYSTYYEDKEQEEKDMSENNYVTKEQLTDLEDKIDLKIKVAVQPIEGKIDNISNQIKNLPTKFENLILKEREYQETKRKETQRYILGTIGVGILSIAVSVILHFM